MAMIDFFSPQRCITNSHNLFGQSSTLVFSFFNRAISMNWFTELRSEKTTALSQTGRFWNLLRTPLNLEPVQFLWFIVALTNKLRSRISTCCTHFLLDVMGDSFWPNLLSLVLIRNGLRAESCVFGFGLCGKKRLTIFWFFAKKAFKWKLG